MFRAQKTQLIDCLNEIQFTTLDITEDVTKVAKKIIEMGILTQKSFDDCQHIGVALINECGCIISWNFKHIVNVKTIRISVLTLQLKIFIKLGNTIMN